MFNYIKYTHTSNRHLDSWAPRVTTSRLKVWPLCLQSVPISYIPSQTSA